jgi:hypothetical protein
MLKCPLNGKVDQCTENSFDHTESDVIPLQSSDTEVVVFGTVESPHIDIDRLSQSIAIYLCRTF